jgi:hypothetical protein
MNEFIPFEKDNFPKLSSYGGILLPLAYAACKIRNDTRGYNSLLEQFTHKSDGLLKFDASAEKDFLATLANKRVLDTKCFELLPKTGSMEHLSTFRGIGCDITAIKLSDDRLNLQNYKDAVNDKFDITFSKGLLDISNASSSKRAMELYALFSNITRKNGYSIHAAGNYVSTLYSTLLDFIGFRIVSFFKFGSGQNESVIILQKYNSKETTAEEFEYLYNMLQDRDKLRYS